MTANTSFLERLAATPAAERPAMLEAVVVAEFRSWLLLEDSEALPLDESYFALGLTSLGMTEIKQRLEAVLGRPIESATLFNNPTTKHLLAYLRSEVLADFFSAAFEQPKTSPERRTAEQDLMEDVLRDLYQV